MEILEETEGLQFHIFVLLFPLEGCLKKLQAKLFPQKPSQLARRKIDALRAHLSSQGPKTAQEIRGPLARCSLQAEVKLVPQLTCAVQSCPAKASSGVTIISTPSGSFVLISFWYSQEGP